MFDRKKYIKPYMQEWRKLHPGYNYAAVKASRNKRREKLGEEAYKELQRAEYRKYRERVLKTERERRAKRDPIAFRKKNTRWMAAVRARKRAATIGDLTDIQKIYDRCHWWRQWFDVSVDHIIPLFHGGTHEAENLQILFRSENTKKSTRLDYIPRVIFI